MMIATTVDLCRWLLQTTTRSVKVSACSTSKNVGVDAGGVDADVVRGVIQSRAVRCITAAT